LIRSWPERRGLTAGTERFVIWTLTSTA